MCWTPCRGLQRHSLIITINPVDEVLAGGYVRRFTLGRTFPDSESETRQDLQFNRLERIISGESSVGQFRSRKDGYAILQELEKNKIAEA